MSDHWQNALRDALLAIVIKELDRGRLTELEAATACMGAAATVLGVLPPAARAKAVEIMAAALPHHAEQRAADIRSGAVDREARH
jgi:hypothetical protein